MRTLRQAALAAARARGVRLGRPGNFTNEGRAKGRLASARALRAKARARAALVLPTIKALRAEGTTSLPDCEDAVYHPSMSAFT